MARLRCGLIRRDGHLVECRGNSCRAARYQLRVSRTVDRALDAGFLQLARFVRSFERHDRILAWQSPLSLLVRLAAWLGLLVAGFALLLLPSVNGSMGQAFSDAGSSMFTLGYAAATGSGSTALGVLGSVHRPSRCRLAGRLPANPLRDVQSA